MYYQCLVLPIGDKWSNQVREIAHKHDNILIKTLDGSQDVCELIDGIFERQGIQLPIVLVGEDIIAHGNYAAVDLMLHMEKHKHVHWEASEGESCI
jgi:hypothetical protein